MNKRVELLSTTNLNFAHDVGKKGHLSSVRKSVYFAPDGENHRGGFRTSYISTIEIKDGVITCNTRNSVYKFKCLEEIEDEVITIMTEAEIKEFEDAYSKIEPSVFGI